MHARRGGKMVVFANDFIGHSIEVEGFFEWFELQTIFGFLTPLKEHFSVSIALDVGANVGNHSIFFSRYFSTVHAFEPHPVTRRVLEINADLYPRIVVHGYGLSDVKRKASLVENTTNLGGSCIGIAQENSMEVELQRLDDIEIDRTKIALIKLDVEGHEANVLQGGMETLNQAMPIVLFETFLEDFSNPMEEVEILNALGYRFAWIQPRGVGVRRHLKRLAMLITRKKIQHIYTGDTIPPAHHPMIIAVPPRWLEVLGMA